MGEPILELLSRSLLAQAAENASSTEKKFQSTTEGLVTAYSSILMMSVIPIIFGSFKSVTLIRNAHASGEKPETMTKTDAMMFPVIASGALFSLYAVFKVFGKQYINMLLTSYFFVIGVLALANSIAPVFRLFISESMVRNEKYEIKVSRKNAQDFLIDMSVDHFEILGFIVSLIVGVWYIFGKHWIANNLFGLAFAQSGIALLQLNSVATGCILLGGLFVYDVFWVFGTEVMVTVAKSFEAPIKLLFPQDFLESGIWGTHHAMLGLGDIVIPGIFIALLLRYDMSKENGSRLYFTVSFIAYIAGLIVTVIVLTVFKHAQPALLYLVPFCVGTPLLVALVMGEIKELFSYRDKPDTDETTDVDASEETKSSADKQAKQQSGISTRSKSKKEE